MDNGLTVAPAQAWLASNIHLRQWRILSAVPPDLIGSFDIVHLRIPPLMFEDNDATPFIQKAKSLLKPGGYLQWDELGQFHIRVLYADPAYPAAVESTPGFAALRTLMGGTHRRERASHLHQTLAQLEFTNITSDTYDDREDVIQTNTHALLMMLEELVAKALPSIGSQEGNRLYRLISHINSEFRRGVMMNMPKVVWVARKSCQQEPLVSGFH